MLLTLSPVLVLTLFVMSSTLFLFAIIISKALNPSNSAGPLPVCLFLEDLCYFFPADFGVSEDILALSDDCFWFPSSVSTEDSKFIPVACSKVVYTIVSTNISDVIITK
jgi:hypothetical protein